MIVAQPGFYNVDPETLGHLPGVRGGATGTLTKFVAKYAYRGIKRFGRRFFKPDKYTYRGAVARGIGAGTIIYPWLDEEDGSGLDSTNERPEQGSIAIRQKYRRRYSNKRSRGGYQRHCCRPRC